MCYNFFMSKFIHLHLHTEYSLLDGAVRIDSLMEKAVEFGMKSVAMTDHGVMYGAVDFYKAAKEKGINPILGCEIYTARRSRFDKEHEYDNEPNHLVLLAKNLTGYKNLLKIVSKAHLEGFYYKPRADYELLEQYSEGIIALSACLAGAIPRAIVEGDRERALETAMRLNKIFGDGNFYLEIQNNGIEAQNIANQGIVEISRKTGIPLVATNDVHYLNKSDSGPHDVLLCIQTGRTVDEPDRMRFPTDEFYFKSSTEMNELFAEFPEALENTHKIAEQCNVELDIGGKHLPAFTLKDETDHFEYLKKNVYIGLEDRFEGQISVVLKQRIEFELEVIKNMDYTDYFLIVSDFINFAKSKGIMVGPGRGSAAGSLVSYCLGITNIDPIKYDLLFERFLNPERISMPDIDIDFCYERRQEVIDYVSERYGYNKVCQIITFGTMAARASIRDVGRALNVSYAQTDIVAKMIPHQPDMTIQKALKVNKDLSGLYDDNNQVRELIDTAMLLEGMCRHASTHAAGVVITREDVVEYVPLQKNDEAVVTQFTMERLEDLGLLKMDFLGLRTLTVIQDSIAFIKENHGIVINVDKMHFEDEKVYKTIAAGYTAGIFQLESAGMTSFMKELSPKNLEDIIAGISLFRPGPMEQIPRYLEFKNQPDNAKYHHPLLKPILGVTYGCMVYQEQVMRIVQDLGGYTLGRADLVRRIMSKKKRKEMEEERETFIKGAVEKHVPPQTASIIFDEMTDFASYAFNKSHAAAYAVVAYQTAYLKTYFPLEFMAATLNSFMGSTERISVYIQECRRLGISVLPPDVNTSDRKFKVDGANIRFGLAAIKNVGHKAADSIKDEREQHGEYNSFIDFCKRHATGAVNKKCVESLIKCGAFDAFDINRRQLISTFEAILESISKEKRNNIEGQVTIFDSGDAKKTAFTYNFPDLEDFDKQRLLNMEKELLGIYVTGNPLDEFEEIILQKANFFSSQKVIDQETDQNIFYDGKGITCAGIIRQITKKITKNNNMMAFVELEDIYGSMEIIVFPNILDKYSSLIINDSKILIKGKLSLREEEDIKIICDEIHPLKNSPFKAETPVKKFEQTEVLSSKPINECLIYINADEVDSAKFESFINYFGGTGSAKIILRKTENGTKFEKRLEGRFAISDSKDVLDELADVIGQKNMYVKHQ